MAYRYGNRKQAVLLPESIESYIPEDDPVRVYDAFIDAIDFTEIGIYLDPNKVGNSNYDPSPRCRWERDVRRDQWNIAIIGAR